jgi:hypothetical protein
VTVLNARCSARARPKAARVHHRPPGARPGHHRDPDPAARKADELDWRAEPAASHRTHPPAVDVDRGAYQPTTPWLPQPDSQRPPAAPRQHDARSLLPAVPTSGGPETRWQTIPWPNLEWHSSAVQPSTRLAYGVPSAATTTSRKSNSSPPRTVDCQRARRCQRCSRWVEDFAERQIKGVGTLEVLAAGGLILLAAFHIAPVLTALAVPASTSGRDSRAKPSLGTPAGGCRCCGALSPQGRPVRRMV